MYIPIKIKFCVTLFIGCSWLAFTIWIALPWLSDLAKIVSLPVAIIIISGVAWIPGFMNTFLLVSYIIDRRPKIKNIVCYPDISILIAAYNEEKSIADTVLSVKSQDYPGKMEIIVSDDGSTDHTVKTLQDLNIADLVILKNPHGGKSSVLNSALARASFDLVISLDADTYLRKDAIKNLVGRLLSDPADTAAVAGSVYVKNTRVNLLTRIQTWDYFHAIAAIKRMQSLFQGTLVAQGAFSIYRKEALQMVGGWDNCVGEDIVLTWGLLKKGFRVGFAESAISFTCVPETYKKFFAQRSRWARGMLEAFRRYPSVLTTHKFYSILFYWNLLFPILDVIYFFIFLPGLIAAFFGIFILAGPITIAVLPLAILQNIFFFKKQKKMFASENLKVRRDIKGFILYVLFYQILMVPACLHGYWSEIAKKRKLWLSK